MHTSFRIGYPATTNKVIYYIATYSLCVVYAYNIDVLVKPASRENLKRGTPFYPGTWFYIRFPYLELLEIINWELLGNIHK